jgi:HK97 family phage prohead protease
MDNNNKLQKKIKYLDCKVEFDKKHITKSVDGGLYIEGYANTIDKDRVGDVVLPTAFEKSLPNYLKNPVLLYQHSWDNVIGKVIDAKVTDNGLWVKAYVSSSKDCEDIRTKIKEGILKTFSIGYDEKEAERDELTKTNYVKDIELLEISIVSIPANPNAIFTQSIEEKFMKKDKASQSDKPERLRGESHSECMHRIISMLMDSEHNYPQDRAVAAAYSICGEKDFDVETLKLLIEKIDALLTNLTQEKEKQKMEENKPEQPQEQAQQPQIDIAKIHEHLNLIMEKLNSIEAKLDAMSAKESIENMSEEEAMKELEAVTQELEKLTERGA